MSLYINFMYVNKCAKTTKWQRELYQNTCIYNNQRFHCAYSAFINVYKANMQIPQYQLQSTILGLKGDNKFQCSKELYSVTKWYFVIMCVLVHLKKPWKSTTVFVSWKLEACSRTMKSMTFEFTFTARRAKTAFKKRRHPDVFKRVRIISRFVLNEFPAIESFSNKKYICLFANISSYRRAALSAKNPIEKAYKKNKHLTVLFFYLIIFIRNM